MVQFAKRWVFHKHPNRLLNHKLLRHSHLLPHPNHKLILYHHSKLGYKPPRR